MARSSPRRNRTASATAADRRTSDLTALGADTASVILQAASVLQSELAAGLAAARRAEQRFRDERRVDPADFEETLSRFRSSGHEVVDMARARFDGLKSQETDELVQRFLEDAHAALDTLMNLVDLAPELANRLLQPAQPKPARPSSKGPRAARREPASRSRGRARGTGRAT
jgi:hypothetical protein